MASCERNVHRFTVHRNRMWRCADCDTSVKEQALKPIHWRHSCDPQPDKRGILRCEECGNWYPPPRAGG